MRTLLLWLCVIPIWLAFIAWLLMPADRFIQPVSLSFDGERFHFIREVPYGAVWGTWNQELSSALGDCPAETGTNFYQDIGLAQVTYPASEAFLQCIPEQGERFVFEVQRRALIGGFLSTRPSSYRWVCIVGGALCESL